VSKLSKLFKNVKPRLPLALAFLFGAFSWYVLSYWRRLLGLPPIVRTRLEGRIDSNLSLGEKAIQIASANLRAGIEKRYMPDGQQKRVLCAGMRHFREPWARDFGFASYGLVELNEIQAIRETLEVFLQLQTPQGQFPVKIHATNMFDRYLISLFGRQQPIDIPIRPKYMTAHNTISLDGNALLIIAALLYLQQFDDEYFCHAHWLALKNGLLWLEGHALGDDELLHQGAYTDWADSISRVGRILYTNVLYWKALQDFAIVAEKYAYEEDAIHFSGRADQVKAVVNEEFWRGDLGYFRTSTQFELLNSDGNLLAVAWGLASEQQSHAILDNMQRLGMADPVPTQVTDRTYGTKYIAIENRVGGIPQYHTLAAWLWLGGWHVVALTRMGRLAEAKVILARIDGLIVRDGVVHEVFGSDGRPLKSFWYSSEAPLTWSAGVIVYAHSCYQRGLTGGKPCTG
jgi:GH15 family glucan-1,4-alpha-glucosidase